MENDHITNNADGSKTVKFKDMPVRFDDVELTGVKMREPKVDDHLAVDGIASVAKREVAIIANLCETSTANISGCTMRQYGRLQEAYQDFLS